MGRRGSGGGVRMGRGGGRGVEMEDGGETRQEEVPVRMVERRREERMEIRKDNK